MTDIHVDVYSEINNAEKYNELPDEILPVCESNLDYYCLNLSGEIIHWTHNGVADKNGGVIYHNQMTVEAAGKSYRISRLKGQNQLALSPS